MQKISCEPQQQQCQELAPSAAEKNKIQNFTTVQPSRDAFSISNKFNKI
jgi:hypothetical protein